MEEYILNTAKGYFDYYAEIFVFIVLCAYVSGAWYIIYRSGTYNFIVNRLWIIYAGAGEFYNEKMNTAWREVIDVEKFRFKTGININSREEAEKLILWLEDKSISFYDFLFISKFFDVQERKVKKINFKIIIFINISLLAFLTALLVLINNYYKNNDYSNIAVYSVVKSKNNFTFNGEIGRMHGLIIDKSYCEYPRYNQLDYSVKEDIKVVCSLVEAKDKEFYKKTIKQQRYIYLLLIVIIITTQLFCFIYGYRYSNALKFIKKYEDKINIKIPYFKSNSKD